MRKNYVKELSDIFENEYSDEELSDIFENPEDRLAAEALLKLEFEAAIEKLPAEEAEEVARKMNEQESFIESLQRSEIDPSYPISDEDIQQEFFEETNWFYPDEDYINKKRGYGK